MLPAKFTSAVEQLDSSQQKKEAVVVVREKSKSEHTVNSDRIAVVRLNPTENWSVEILRKLNLEQFLELLAVITNH